MGDRDRRQAEDAKARRDLLDALTGWRHAAGMSQQQVAEAMVPPTTQSAVSELETGATEARLDTLQRYARAIGLRLNVTVGISLQALFTGLPAYLAETEPYDTEAGLARLRKWIDEQERDQQQEVRHGQA